MTAITSNGSYSIPYQANLEFAISTLDVASMQVIRMKLLKTVNLKMPLMQIIKSNAVQPLRFWRDENFKLSEMGFGGDSFDDAWPEY